MGHGPEQIRDEGQAESLLDLARQGGRKQRFQSDQRHVNLVWIPFPTTTLTHLDLAAEQLVEKW